MQKVNMKIFKPKNVKQILITVHGFAGDSDSSVICKIADELIKNDVLVIAFDLPCHGADKQKSILKLQDCFDYLSEVERYAKEKYKDVPISYFATSFGAYLLLNHLKNCEYVYRNIILRAPAVYMSQIIKNKLLKEHRYTFKDLKNKTLNLGYARELNIDINFYNSLVKNSLKDYYNSNFLHIIQGKKDDIVDYKKNERFFNKTCKNNHKFYYFENADHRFKNPGELEEIVKITKDILLK